MTNYYVKKGSNGGGSESNPFGSISAAIKKGLKPGDTVYVMNGTYHETILMNGLRGNSSNRITITPYSNHTPWVDGLAGVGGLNAGLPAGSANKTGPGGKIARSTNLVKVSNCRYVDWEVNIRGSMGRAIAVYNASQYVRIRNCKIHKSRQHNIVITGGCRNITVDGVTWTESGDYYPSIRASNSGTDWAAGCSVRGSHYVTVKNCVGYHNWGEVYIGDANQGGSTNLIVEDCVFYDNMKGPYLHAVQNGTFRNNVVYRSDEEVKKRKYSLDSHGISMNSFENDRARIGTSNVQVYNNLIINMGVGTKVSGSATKEEQTGTRIMHNTIVNCTVGANLGAANKSNMHFRNNIIVDCNRVIEDRTKNDTRASSDWTFGNNVWQSNPGSPYYSAGTDVIAANPGLVNKGAAVKPGQVNVNNYKLGSGSGAIAAGANLTAYVPEDAFGATRATSPDCGWHEYDGVATPSSPTVTIASDVTSGETPLTVDFAGTTVTGGNSPYEYEWDFGDGSTSSVLEPTHTYEQPGTYTVTLTATDDDDYVGEDSIVIGSTAPNAGGDNVSVEVVSFEAGDASFSVSGKPDAIIFSWTNSTGSAVSDAVMGSGMYAWAAGQHKQYSMAIRSQNGENPTQTDEATDDESFALMVDEDGGNVLWSGQITGTTSSTVSMSWDGTTASEDIVAIVFYGESVTGSDIVLADLKSAGESTEVYSGSWGFLFAPVVSRPFPTLVGTAQLSLGFANIFGQKGFAGYSSRSEQPFTEVAGAVGSDRIAWVPRAGNQIDTNIWSSSGVSFTALEDVNQVVPILMVGIPTDFQTSITMEETPVSGESTSWGSATNPQAAIVIGTRSSNAGKTSSTLDTGALTFYATDGSTSELMAISTQNNAQPSDDWSLRSPSQWGLPDFQSGSLAVEGDVSLGSSSLDISYTATDFEPRVHIVALFGEGSTGSGPSAYFDVTAPDYEPFPYTETVTVQSQSTDDGTYSISSYSWDWGDGTSAGSGASDTHDYTEAGEFTITLTVTDANSATDTYTRTVKVELPEPSIAFEVDPVPAELGEEITLDASATSAGGTETIDWDNAIWIIEEDLGDDEIYSFTLQGGDTVTTTIRRPGQYDVRLYVPYENPYYWQNPGYKPNLLQEGALEVGNVDWTLDFESDDGGAITVVGPYEVTFTPISLGGVNIPDTATQEWDFGDTNTDTQDWDGGNPISHTYSAVGSTASYDVELTVELSNSDYTVTKQNYVTVIPAQTAPPTIPQLIATAEALQDVLDNLIEHLGHIPSDSWTQSSTYDRVYYCQLTRPWVDGLTIGLVENGEALSSQASEAAVNSNAGSFYATFSDPVLTIYVRGADSDDPSQNGHYYRFTAVT